MSQTFPSTKYRGALGTRSLIDKGCVKVKNFSNKRNYSYILTPAGPSEKTSMTAMFLERKREEYHLSRIFF